MIQNFTLINKKNLTHNVYELVFKLEKEINMLPGQFITFLIDGLGGRAYSILKIKSDKIILIIKKREISQGGRGGSKLICELKIGDKLKGVGPAGHFLLNENNNNKLFIGTGTGFVPLYNMIESLLENNNKNKIKLIFGIREEDDVFYLNELQNLKKKYSNFGFHLYISRVKDLHQFKLNNPGIIIKSGYTTNFLTKQNIKDFSETYICGAPNMIESSIEKLKKLDFDEKNIYFEKY
ncbi:FAD-dependent oxidoreductase [Candidatus Gracilibacteria bacterium]|nr:FAD-dependent oxidoreductase [Candidatus Gracilibacteria bacterium]